MCSPGWWWCKVLLTWNPTVFKVDRSCIEGWLGFWQKSKYYIIANVIAKQFATSTHTQRDKVTCWCSFAAQNKKQAGAVLGQAQLKLGFDFNLINLHWIDEQDRLLPRLTILQYQYS